MITLKTPFLGDMCFYEPGPIFSILFSLFQFLPGNEIYGNPRIDTQLMGLLEVVS